MRLNSLNSFFPEGVDSDKDKQRCKGTDKKRAERNRDCVALSSEGTGSAHDGGRDHCHFPSVSGVRLNASEPARVDDGGEADQHSADHKCEKPVHIDIDTGKSGRIAVGTDRVKIPAEFRLSCYKDHHNQHDDRDVNTVVDSECPALAELQKAGRKTVKPCASGQDNLDASVNAEKSQRRHDRIEPKEDDNRSVYESHSGSESH